MKTTGSRCRALVAVTVVLTAITAVHETIAGEQPQVVAQQLHSPKASKKVSAVLWTRRPSTYTLQVVFSRTGGVVGIVDGQSVLGPQGSSTIVTAWVLRADGTAIPAKRTPSLTEPRKPGLPVEILYTLSLAEGKEAVAVAIRIDDEYFIEALQAL